MPADSAQFAQSGDSVWKAMTRIFVHASKNGDIAAFEQLGKAIRSQNFCESLNTSRITGKIPQDCGSRRPLLKGLPKLGPIPRGFPILDLG